MDGTFRYINLVTSPAGQRISSYLSTQPNAMEIPRAPVFRELRKNFRENYIELMGRLNTANGSLLWWAMSFTNKYSLATSLCRNVFNLLLISRLVRLYAEPLLVIADDPDLADQVKEWSKKEDVQVVDLVERPQSAQGFLKKHTPAGLLKTITRAFLLRITGGAFQPKTDGYKEYLVIVTHTHTWSFESGGHYKDAYFGALMDQAAGSTGEALILGLPYENPFGQLSQIKNLQSGLPVVPIESCLQFSGLVACAFRALGWFLHPGAIKGTVAIEGIDVSLLISRAIGESSRSGDLFWNLRVHYGVRGLSNKINVGRCLYPYENRAWEKSLIMGLRQTQPQARIAGYQHTSITLSHTNFIFAQSEANLTPLPDLILTTGEVTKDWLESEGNYPAGIFKLGCALRQRNSIRVPDKGWPREIIRVLVALATSLEEYVNTLVFLENAFPKNSPVELRLRPHPIIPIEAGLKVAPLEDTDFFTTSTGSLEDDLEWADVVLYASSTVGMEAVAAGIPAIYLDLGDFLDTDPMFGWEEFKWAAKEPSELLSLIQSIESMPQDRYRELQAKGKEYAVAYLVPASAGRISSFLEF